MAVGVVVTGAIIEIATLFWVVPPVPEQESVIVVSCENGPTDILPLRSDELLVPFQLARRVQEVAFELDQARVTVAVDATLTVLVPPLAVSETVGALVVAAVELLGAVVATGATVVL